MCHLCREGWDREAAERDALDEPLDARPAGERPVPINSGEAAIYSPEHLTRREGNNLGALPLSWQHHVI